MPNCSRCGANLLTDQSGVVLCSTCYPKPIPHTLVTTVPTTRALLGHSDPSGRDIVGHQNSSIMDRMSLLVKALEQMAIEMRGIQPMSPSLIKLISTCKRTAVDLEEEMLRRKGTDF